MKKNILTVLIFLSIAAISFFAFGCNGDATKGWGPLFYNICQEVELDEAIVKGNIGSMIETQSYLYCLNGKIWRKGKTSVRGWSEQEIPANTDKENTIATIACNDSYIYCLEYNIESKVCSLYYSPIQGTLSWSWINHKASVDNTYTLVGLFDNKATPGTGKREVFVSLVNTSNYSQYKVYRLTGTTFTDITSQIGGTNYKYVTWISSFSSDYPANPTSASWISNNNITVFATDNLLTSNLSDHFYHVSDGVKNTDNIVAYSTDGANWNTSVKPDIGKLSYHCASYYKDENSNHFIYLGKVGTNTGLTVVRLDNSQNPTTTIVSPTGTNYSSCLGDMNAIGIFPLPLGSGNLYVGGVIYLSTKASSNTNKLWGYYPSRGTWNCE